MAIKKEHLRSFIQETLRELEPEIPYSETAVELLMLTAAQESLLGYYLHQGRGPALGIFQMEPATHNDIWDNYLKFKPNLSRRIREALKWRWITPPEASRLKYDLKYAIIMTRIHYRRVPNRFPVPPTTGGLARYWKAHYNTPVGRGTWKQAEHNYKRFALK